jgi:hypothetical protein
MIPPFEESGLLPPGVHEAIWQEIADRFGGNERREALLDGLRLALLALKEAGCRVAYVDGSFVTESETPGDFDACWDPRGINFLRLDPTLYDFEAGRRAQKRKFGGELFPMDFTVGPDGETFLEAFQKAKLTRQPKGIVMIDLERFR